MKRFQAWIVLLTAGVAWGLSFSLAKIAVTSGAHPIGTTLWQAGIGTVLLFVITFVRQKRMDFKPSFVALYVACALLGTAVPGVLYFYAANHIPAGVLSITVALVPILTVFLAALLRVERMIVSRFIGVACGLLAILLLVIPESSLPDASAVPWVLIACVAAACYTAENLVISMRMPQSADPIMVTCGMHLAATAILLPIVFASGTYVSPKWPFTEVEWSILSLSTINALAYSLFIYLVNRSGPVFASQTAYVVTLSGVLWGIGIFGEAHSYWVWLSLVVMLGGLALVTPRQRSLI